MVTENLEMVQGSTFTLNGQVVQGDTGVALNLTGKELYFTARWNYPDFMDETIPAVIQCDSVAVHSGIVVTDAGSGLFTLTITPTKTLNVVPPHRTDLLYDLVVTLPGTGDVWTVMYGTLTVYPSVI